MTSTSSPNRFSGIAEHLTRSQLLLSAFTVILLLAGWSIFVWFGVGTLLSSPNKPDPQPKPKPNSNPQIERQPLDRPHPTPTEVPYADAERDLLMDLQRTEITARLLPLQQQLDQAQRLQSEWTERLRALRTNAAGRSLATIENARKILVLEQIALPIQLDDLRQPLNDIAALLRQARDPLPSFQELDLRLSTVHTQLNNALATLHERDAILTQMLATATQPQTSTLQQTLDALSQQEDEEVQQAVTAQGEALQATHLAEVQKAQDRQRQLQADLATATASLPQVESETTRALQTAQAELQKSQQALASQRAAAQQQLQQDLPAVRELLTPFISAGYRQLDPESSLVPTADALPLSYTGLIRAGALEVDHKGLEILFYLAQSTNAYGKTNDRALGAFPEYRSEFDLDKPENFQKVKQAQAFLRTHGPAMVETKLLLP